MQNLAGARGWGLPRPGGGSGEGVAGYGVPVPRDQERPEVRPIPPASWPIVRGLVVLAWVLWGASALVPWYSSNRVDSDPDTTNGLGFGLVALALVLVPFVLATVVAANRARLPLWAALAAGASAVPGLWLGFLVPAIAEASGTDTTVVAEIGPKVLGAAVVVAFLAAAMATRPISPGAASSG